jgi:thymidylate synthase (FAD)
MAELELVNKVGVSLIGTNASDDMVAMAAWVSHDADSEARLDNREQVEKLINFLYSNRHMSPFEHGQFIFKVDVPLFVAREFHRHRTMSYNEVSGRYTEMKPRFWEGTAARIQKGKPGDYYFESGTSEQTAVYKTSKSRAAKAAWKEYQQRLDAGIAKEQAREDLPLSLMTQFYATVNPRNLMQFLDLRNDKHALKEIRDVAVQMEAILAKTMPLTYKAYIGARTKREAEARQLELLKVRVVELEAQNLEHVNAYAELSRQFNDVSADFNGLYVENERLKQENQKLRDGWDEEFQKLATGGVPNSIMPVTLGSTSCEPVGKYENPNVTYNIYVNTGDDAEEIGNKVIETLHARKRRGRTI